MLMKLNQQQPFIKLCMVAVLIFSLMLVKLTPKCQFHQHFYAGIFRTKVLCAAFSSYISAL